AVEPEGHGVRACGGGRDLVAGRQQVGAEDPRFGGCTIRGGPQFFLGVVVYHHDPGQRVVEVVVVVLASLQERVDRDGYGADTDRAEEGGDPAWAVVAGDQDALLAPDADVEQGAGGAAGELVQVAVGEVGRDGVDGDLGRAAGGEVALDQVGADVVAVGQLHHRKSWHGTEGDGEGGVGGRA